jgi:hypothetical protein
MQARFRKPGLEPSRSSPLGHSVVTERCTRGQIALHRSIAVGTPGQPPTADNNLQFGAFLLAIADIAEVDSCLASTGGRPCTPVGAVPVSVSSSFTVS